MYERDFWFSQNGLNPKAVNSFGAMVPYMGPILLWALEAASFARNDIKLMTMGQIAATFTDKINSVSLVVFGRGAATLSGAGPVPASGPSAAAEADGNDYHDWCDEEDWRLLQRDDDDCHIFSRENFDKYSRPSSARSSKTFKEDFLVTPDSYGLSVCLFT